MRAQQEVSNGDVGYYSLATMRSSYFSTCGSFFPLGLFAYLCYFTYYYYYRCHSATTARFLPEPEYHHISTLEFPQDSRSSVYNK